MLSVLGRLNPFQTKPQPYNGGKWRRVHFVPRSETLEPRRLLTGHDTFATAIPIGLISNTPTSETGSLTILPNSGGKVDPDFYSFTVPEGSTINTTSTVPIDSNPRLDTHIYEFPMFQGINNPLSLNINTGGIQAGVSEPGHTGFTYYIEVKVNLYSSGISSFPYIITLSAQSPPDLVAKSASYNGATYTLNYSFMPNNYSGPVTVGFYRSSQKTFVANDPNTVLITSSSINVKTGILQTGSIKLSSSLTSKPTSPYLLLVIDPANAVKEATATRSNNTLPFSAPGTTGTYEGVGYVVYQNEILLGGSRSWRNNNPGNLAFAGSFAVNHGAIGTDGTFAVFADVPTGTAAITADFLTAKYQALTIYGAMSTYAPPIDNNTAAYIAFIESQTGLDPDTEMSSLSSAQLALIVSAIRVYEGWIPGQVFLNNASSPAWVLALLYNGTP